MKKHLILGSIVLFAVLGMAFQAFAATATPTITSVVGTSGGTNSRYGFINLTGSTTVAIAGTYTASSTASTTVLALFTSALFNATGTNYAIYGNEGTYSFTVDASAVIAGNVGVVVFAKTGEEASSTAASTSTVKDIAPPTITNITMYSNNASSTVAKAGDIVYLTASSSDTVNGDLATTLFGHSGSSVTNSNPANGWMSTTTMSSSDSAAAATFSMVFNDLAGNAVTKTAVTAGIPVFFYRIPTFTLVGYNPMNCMFKVQDCADPGASAVDSRGIAVTLSTLSTVSTSTVGKYSIAYGGVDLAGNAATSTREVNVFKRVVNTGSGTVPTMTASPTASSAVGSTPAAEVVAQTPAAEVVLGSNEIPVTVINVSGIANAVKRQLKQGVSGADVKLIQTVLSNDKTIYPEGLKTGFYGSLTRAAVQRFQEKYGIAKKGTPGYGEVGPKTKAKLIEIYGM